MKRKKQSAHDSCRRIAAVKFSGDNYICAGENMRPTFSCDNVRLCVKGAVAHRKQEMTLQEAVTIRDCLSAVISDLSARK